MSKKILIVTLSLICMLPTEKLMGMVGDSNKRGPGYYNCLPEDGDDITEYAASRPRKKPKSVTSSFLVNKKPKVKCGAEMQECAVLPAHSEQATDGVRMAQDVLKFAAVSLVAPIIVACLPRVAGAAASARCSGEVTCNLDECARSIDKYYLACFGNFHLVEDIIANSCEKSMVQYYAACFSNFKVTQDLTTYAQDCGQRSYNEVLEVDHLHKKSMSIAEQLKEDKKFLRNHETYDQQRKAARGKKSLKDLESEELKWTGARYNDFVSDWMRWNWMPVYDRSIVLQELTIPETRKKFMAAIKKLHGLLESCPKNK